MLHIKLFLAALLVSTLAFADAQEGAEMFNEAKCMECHNVEDFGGEDSKAKDYKHMRDSVDACQRNNDAEWFEEDVDSVADHLNKEHYKFKK